MIGIRVPDSLLKMDVPSVVGITLMVLGSLLVLTGALLCYLTKVMFPLAAALHE